MPGPRSTLHCMLVVPKSAFAGSDVRVVQLIVMKPLLNFRLSLVKTPILDLTQSQEFAVGSSVSRCKLHAFVQEVYT